MSLLSELIEEEESTTSTSRHASRAERRVGSGVGVIKLFLPTNPTDKYARDIVSVGLLSLLSEYRGQCYKTFFVGK
jgi:hypothetical protein